MHYDVIHVTKLLCTYVHEKLGGAWEKGNLCGKSGFYYSYMYVANTVLYVRDSVDVNWHGYVGLCPLSPL